MTPLHGCFVWEGDPSPKRQAKRGRQLKRWEGWGLKEDLNEAFQALGDAGIPTLRTGSHRHFGDPEPDPPARSFPSVQPGLARAALMWLPVLSASPAGPPAQLRPEANPNRSR